MAYNFQTGKSYTFALYPSYVFSTDFKFVTVLGVVSYEIATQYADIYPLHIQVYSSLPAGTPNDPKAYDYLLIKTTANVTMVLGLPWIKENTIVENEGRTMQITVANVSATDVDKVRNALVQNGYNNLSITMLADS